MCDTEDVWCPVGGRMLASAHCHDGRCRQQHIVAACQFQRSPGLLANGIRLASCRCAASRGPSRRSSPTASLAPGFRLASPRKSVVGRLAQHGMPAHRQSNWKTGSFALCTQPAVRRCGLPNCCSRTQGANSSAGTSASKSLLLALEIATGEDLPLLHLEQRCVLARIFHYHDGRSLL